MTQVRTRFAPSPTGMLHIGGARTALFSYLYAKAKGGEYCVRIEDTDRERSTEEAKQVIIDALNWLGLAPDNSEYILQSEKLEHHKTLIQQLLENGKAYECFASKEELDDMREKQKANKQAPRYDGRHRNLTENEKDAFRKEGRIPAIRLKIQEEGVTAWNDDVQGTISIQNSTLDDFIIQRSDGWPTYNFVVAVDDHDMGITHVIRGDDHINNTPKQISVYKAFGWDIPAFAHIPMIHGKNGKMSKRDGATDVLQYKRDGFLPQALNSYLMRLGWSLGDEELISMEKAIQHFDITDVNKGASTFDMAKLEWVNAQFIKTIDTEVLVAELEPFFTDMGLEFTDKAKTYLLNGGLDELRPRAKKLCDLASNASFYLKEPPFTLDEKFAGEITDESKEILQKISHELNSLNNWNKEEISLKVKSFIEDNNLKFPQVGKPLRIALTGTTNAPSVDGIMAVLGKEESLKRVKLV